MKYARLEAERRFLLSVLPDLAWARVMRITDRYLDGTRLRLRLVEEDGLAIARKLGHKVPRAVSVNEHTSLYLDQAEYAALAVLPGHELRKTRRIVGGWAFDEHADGLLLAETEQDLDPWFPYVREVTEEIAFTGGALARGGR